MKKICYIILLFVVSFAFASSVYADTCTDNATTNSQCISCGGKWENNMCIETYKNYESAYVSCGSGMIKKIPSAVPTIVNIVYNLIRIAVPILLIIFGSIDLLKGVTAQKDDEIKKGQQILVKRLIAAVLIFFIFSIVKFVISIASDNSNIIDCAECFISNNCDSIN